MLFIPLTIPGCEAKDRLRFLPTNERGAFQLFWKHSLTFFSPVSRQYFDLSSIHAAFRELSKSMNFLRRLSKSASDCGI